LLEQKSLPNDVLQIMNKNMDYLYKPVPLWILCKQLIYFTKEIRYEIFNNW
jgi:hypothetical protein